MINVYLLLDSDISSGSEEQTIHKTCKMNRGEV